jgi:hypothetical protein
VTATERAVSLMESLCVDEKGTTWGESATDWQREDARAVLDVDTPGVPRRHFLTRPRGGRKTADVAGYLIAGLLCQAPAGVECYSFSVDQKNAAMVLRSMRELVVFTGLQGAIRMTESRAVQLVRMTADGRTVTVDPALAAQYEPMAADSASANGLRPWFTVVDEWSHWRDARPQRDLSDTLLSLLEKGTDRRFVAILNAGAPEHFTYARRAIALKAPSWNVHEVPGPLPWLTPDQLESLKTDLRLPWKIERLINNVWTSGGSKLTAAEDVEHCLRDTISPLGPVRGLRYAVGVDLGHRKDFSAAAVCHTEIGEQQWKDGRLLQTGRRVVVDDLRVWKPRVLPDGTRVHVDLAEVEAWVAGAARMYGASVYLDLSQAAQMQQSLVQQGIRAEAHQPTQQLNSKIALSLYRLLADRLMSLPNDQELAEELARIVLVESSPGIYKLDIDRDEESVGHHDRTSAIGFAVHALLHGPESADWPGYPTRIVQQGRWTHLRNDRGGLSPAVAELRQRIKDPEPAGWRRVTTGVRSWR